MADEAAKAITEAEQDPGAAVAMPVCLAFQLGWDMNRLYRVASLMRPFAYSGDSKLPSQRDFGGALNTERRLASVSSGLRRLAGALEAAGLARPAMTDLISRYTGGGPKEEVREAVYRLHVETLITVQAADPRLGSAYNLGRAFADSATQSDLEVLKKRFSFYRVQGLREELEQLAGSFPPHAAHAVSDSLCVWQAALGPRLEAGASGKGPEDALPRQAETWRGLLSGERLGSDRLDTDDYAGAAKRLVNHAGTVAWGVVRSYGLALAAGLAIVVGGLAVAIAAGGAVAVVGGIGAAASALGVSWKGIAATLSALSGHLRAPLWEAELDLAIAHAITVREARQAYARLPASEQRCKAIMRLGP